MLLLFSVLFGNSGSNNWYNWY